MSQEKTFFNIYAQNHRRDTFLSKKSFLKFYNFISIFVAENNDANNKAQFDQKMK